MEKSHGSSSVVGNSFQKKVDSFPGSGLWSPITKHVPSEPIVLGVPKPSAPAFLQNSPDCSSWRLLSAAASRGADGRARIALRPAVV